MSLLSAIEEAIKTCKVEQAKLNGCIEHCREILLCLSSRHPAEPEETELAEENPADASAGEKEDIELLEQALEKALRVRTGSDPSKRDSCRNRISGAQSETVTATDVLISSAVAKEGQTTRRSTSKSARPDGKGDKKSGFSSGATLRSGPQSKIVRNRNTIQNRFPSSARAAHHQASRAFQQTVSASASPDQITASLSKNKTVRVNVAGDGDLSRAASVSYSVASPSDTDGSGTSRLQQHDVLQSEQTKWKSLRSKQNRLWGKVQSLQRTPALGRSRFMERIRATFPTDWPCGSPAQTRALLERLTDQAQRCRAEDILTKHASDVEQELGGQQNDCDPSLTRENLQQMAAELRVFTTQVSKEWKAWDRWRPEGGCLCPSGGNGVLGDGGPSLPPTITYRTEKELQELERLRTRVALLQQELHLDRVLMDTLSPHLSSVVAGTRCPHPGMLRDLYSLLGEGGERFPAIVLDSEAE
nr:tubulin epsilon and delta complex protein 2 [Nothobranchius furzeri]